MKVEIEKSGSLKITAETITEYFALRYLYPVPLKRCETCGQVIPMLPMIIDCSVINQE